MGEEGLVFQVNSYSYGDNSLSKVDILGLAWGESLEWIEAYLIESFRQMLYDVAISAGSFSEQKLPRTFLRKYIYQERSTYVLSRQELLDEVKPRGTITRCSSFVRDLSSKCNGKQAQFLGNYVIPVFDTGHKTGGLGNFSMRVSVKVECCGEQQWKVSGSASMLTDPWDFNPSLKAAVKETIDLLDYKIKGKIPWLAGRELRTYLGSFIPGSPFDITSNAVLDAYEDMRLGIYVFYVNLCCFDQDYENSVVYFAFFIASNLRMASFMQFRSGSMG